MCGGIIEPIRSSGNPPGSERAAGECTARTTSGPRVRYAVVIPAYRPGEALADIVSALSGGQSQAIILVDDGSGPSFESVFARAAAYPDVHLLSHECNRGKGAALKTAIRFAQAQFPDLEGVVTADADGQHHPEDIRSVAGALLDGTGALVLGARAFQGAVPLRSRVGNSLSRAVMHLLLGRKIQDTQTGLRGIPASLLTQVLQLDSNGYEFELEMLLLAHHLSLPIVEEPIRTIYEPGNQSSHFNPFVDSMKIYFVLLRFASVSLMTAVLDNVVFYVAYRRTGHVLSSQVLGRTLAVAFNYWMVRRSVFYSRQRHGSTLPKYLALVAASGTASYGGIRLLGMLFRIHPVIAKLMVESVLFFANFAVQRVLIFSSGQPERRRDVSPGVLSICLWVIFAGLLGVELYGFATSHLFAQDIWYPVGLQHLWRYSRIFALVSLPVLALRPRWYLPLVSAGALVVTAMAAGPAALAGAALFLLSACTLGRRLVEDEILATLLGTASYIFLMLGTARLPMNYPLLWAGVLAAPLVIDRREVARRLTRWVRWLWTPREASYGYRAAVALLAYILGIHWLAALKPETSADGLAMHLAIPTNIAAHHAMTFEPARILWSVMPMGADWAYSIVYLLGGELATHLLNFAMLVVLLRLLYVAVNRRVPPSTALLLTALFAATPLVQLVTGSLFVENVLAAFLLGMLTAMWRFGESGEPKLLYAAAILGGAALTTKLAALPLVLLALPFAAWEARRHFKRVRTAGCLLAAGLLLATALPTYCIAWARTGDPVYPFLNAKFGSPLLNRNADIRDYRFRQPLTWHTPFDLTFRTSLYYEGQNGSAGFEYLILAPLALLALAAIPDRKAVSATVIALAAAVLVLRSEPNLRYLYCCLPLLFIPFAGLLAWARRNDRLLHTVLIAYAVVCAGINIYFLPASGWYQKDFYSLSLFRSDSRERFFRDESPVRAVIDYYNRHFPNSTVLLLADNDLADPRGEVYENHWHQYDTWLQIRNAFNLPEMARLVNRWKIQYVVGRSDADPRKESRGLRQFLSECTATDFAHGGFYLAKVDPECAGRADAATASPAPPGAYDDFDAPAHFAGDWLHADGEFPEAYHHTVSYTDTAGAEVSVPFRGSGITYVFTRAPNRGEAEILIDGVKAGIVDLYAAKPLWQSRYHVCCIGIGTHVLTVRVLGTSRKESTGRFVDVDEFVVD